MKTKTKALKWISFFWSLEILLHLKIEEVCDARDKSKRLSSTIWKNFGIFRDVRKGKRLRIQSKACSQAFELDAINLGENNWVDGLGDDVKAINELLMQFLAYL